MGVGMLEVDSSAGKCVWTLQSSDFATSPSARLLKSRVFEMDSVPAEFELGFLPKDGSSSQSCHYALYLEINAKEPVALHFRIEHAGSCHDARKLCKMGFCQWEDNFCEAPQGDTDVVILTVVEATGAADLPDLFRAIQAGAAAEAARAAKKVEFLLGECGVAGVSVESLKDLAVASSQRIQAMSNAVQESEAALAQKSQELEELKEALAKKAQESPVSRTTSASSTNWTDRVARTGDELNAYKERLNDQIKSHRFDFWFLDAAMLRRWDKDKDGPLRKHQELIEMPGWLMKWPMSLQDLLSGRYASRYLVVSHRWVDAEHPDLSCEKTRQLCELLQEDANRTIEGVWIDFACVPQRERTKQEEAFFDASLRVINLLYLGLRVLIFFDLQYVGRFWCCYEAFLAMHSASEWGIRPTLDDSGYIVRCLGASKAMDVDSLRKVWKDKTPQEALELLAQEDIRVTNTKDKNIQLSKLKTMDDDIKEYFRRSGP